MLTGESMLSFILDGPEKLRMVDMPIPEPAPGEVRVRVAYAGVCASDISVYQGLRKSEDGKGNFRIGHEMSGVIDKVGARVTGLKVGDRVTCIGVWGCFSEYVVSEPIGVLKLHPDISLLDGSIVEVLPSVAMAAFRSGITESDDVLVYGQGLTGLLLTRLLYYRGCKRLIAVDQYEEKLKISREFGASHTINTSHENVREALAKISGNGVDFAIIATRDGNDVIKAAEWARVRGKIINFGAISPCDGFDYYELHRKGLSIIKENSDTPGMFEHRKVWREAMQLVADGILPTALLRTHLLPMRDLQQAVSMRLKCSPDVIHVVMENEWAMRLRLSERSL